MTDTSNQNQPSKPGSDTRVASTPLAPVSRCIIIGLGGTGHQVLLDIRRRIIDKYGSLENLPIANFIEIDTDEDVLRDQTVRDDDPPEVNLQTSEKLLAKIGDVQNLEENFQEYPHISSWLDRNALLRGKDVQHGAGAIRARGRLALFRNYDQLQMMLESAYKRVADPRVMERCQQLGLRVSPSITVYIVGSLLGGTCSGMFLDMAYIAGRVIPGNPDVIGIFSIPPVAGGRQDHRANAYAALLELNHYCYPHNEFRAQYTPTQQQEFRSRREPFTYCYLVGMYNGQLQISSVQDQVTLVSHSIFLDLTSEFQAQKRSNRDNFQQFLVHTDGIGCPQTFMSFGLSSIHFPKDKVISACAYRLAAETVSNWISTEVTYSDEQLHRYVTDRLAEMKLLPGDVNQWLRMSSEGRGLDMEIDGWREGLNEQLVSGKPPAVSLAPTISQADQGMQQQNFRDVDPNADVFRKNPENLGLFIRQVQRNATSRGIQQIPKDLETWVARMVDDPRYRQSTARGALLYARQMFTQAAAGLDATVQQNFAPSEPMREQAKEGALHKLHSDAGSLVLKMVFGAYADTINQDRELALQACSNFYRSKLDTIVARHAARLYQDLPTIIDRLIADLDAYSVKLDSIRNDLKAREQETIGSPVFVNGERLWERDTDIDHFYGIYATTEKKENLSAATVRSVTETGQLYALRGLDPASLKRKLVESAAGVFAGIKDDVDVLTRFVQKYPDQSKRLEAVRQVYRLSQPFVDLKPAFYQSAEDFYALDGKRQTVIGIHNGSQPGNPAETEFQSILAQVERLAPEKFAALNNRYEVLFLREAAAFPLRLLKELDSYRQDYDFFMTQGATQNPLHIRKDVTRWEPIYVPGSNAQDAAWETFAIGWACGVIQDKVDRKGQRTFTTSFRDEFGMPVDRTVGQFLDIGRDQQREADHPLDDDSPVLQPPPMEAHNIILSLCQDKPLMDGVRRSIEQRIVNLGSGQFAATMIAHAEEQKLRNLSFYEVYRQRLVRFMSDKNMRPDTPAQVATAAATMAQTEASPGPAAPTAIPGGPAVGSVFARAVVQASPAAPQPPAAAPSASAAPVAPETCICGSPIEPGATMCPACRKPFICRNNHKVRPVWKKCPFCGDDLSPRVEPAPVELTCPSCHAPIEPEFKMCPECGAEIAPPAA